MLNGFTPNGRVDGNQIRINLSWNWDYAGGDDKSRLTCKMIVFALPFEKLLADMAFKKSEILDWFSRNVTDVSSPEGRSERLDSCAGRSSENYRATVSEKKSLANSIHDSVSFSFKEDDRCEVFLAFAYGEGTYEVKTFVVDDKKPLPKPMVKEIKRPDKLNFKEYFEWICEEIRIMRGRKSLPTIEPIDNCGHKVALVSEYNGEKIYSAIPECRGGAYYLRGSVDTKDICGYIDLLEFVEKS